MLERFSTYFSRRLFIVGRYDHNIAKYHAVFDSFDMQNMLIAQAPLVLDPGVSRLMPSTFTSIPP